ncbi:MAG: hypothetical protein HC913_01270 [Microscillaceae bacterium]|nr:hypothetical protein [Microscillaceae bacterium]
MVFAFGRNGGPSASTPFRFCLPFSYPLGRGKINLEWVFENEQEIEEYRLYRRSGEAGFVLLEKVKARKSRFVYHIQDNFLQSSLLTYRLSVLKTNGEEEIVSHQAAHKSFAEPIGQNLEQ